MIKGLEGTLAEERQEPKHNHSGSEDTSLLQKLRSEENAEYQTVQEGYRTEVHAVCRYGMYLTRFVSRGQLYGSDRS